MEQSPIPENEQHEGDKYLELLGLGNIADSPIPHSDLRMRDFLEICGDHARPLLVGLDNLDRDDPRFEATRQILRGYIGKFVESPEK